MIKKAIDDFITENYTQINEVATTLYYDPSELISITYESIINGNVTKWLIESIETDKLYLYFFIAMRNQSINLFKKKQKLKYSDLEITDVEDDDEKDDFIESNIESFNALLQQVDVLLSKNIITWYQHRIFNLFYNFDEMIDIKDMSKEDVAYYRKMSLRKMEKFLGISYVSIHYVLSLIKKELNKMNN